MQKKKYQNHPHLGSVVDRLTDIRGLKLVRAAGDDILITAFLDKHFDLEEIAHGVFAHLKGQSIEFREEPTPATVRKRLAPKVATVRSVAGEEVLPTLSLWVRLPTKGDRCHRALEAQVELARRAAAIRHRLFGRSGPQGLADHTVMALIEGGFSIGSRFKSVQNRVL